MKMIFRALENWCFMAAHHDAVIASFTWTWGVLPTHGGQFLDFNNNIVVVRGRREH